MKPNQPNYALAQFASTCSESKLTALAQIVDKPDLMSAGQVLNYHKNSKTNQEALVHTGLMLSVEVVKEITLFDEVGESAKKCAEKIELLLDKYGLTDVEIFEFTNYCKVIERYNNPSETEQRQTRMSLKMKITK